MDRIEDETIRYLFFLQVPAPGGVQTAMAAGPRGRPEPMLPFSDDEDEDEEEDEEEALVTANAEERRAAQNAVEDFTRNIQRKKDKEMAELQFAGGSGTPTERSKPL